jgi:hypothetical protein
MEHTTGSSKKDKWMEVCLRCVLLTSYGFLQTPPLASDALAIQIIFPSVGVILQSCKEMGLPASPSKQKNRPEGRFSNTACFLFRTLLLR